MSELEAYYGKKSFFGRAITTWFLFLFLLAFGFGCLCLAGTFPALFSAITYPLAIRVTPDLLVFYAFLALLFILAFVVNRVRWLKSGISRPIFFAQGISWGEFVAVLLFLGTLAAWIHYWWFEIGSDSDNRIARVLGHVNDITLSLLIFPVTRVSFWGVIFGMDFEKTVKYHRWVARITVLSITAHMLAWWIQWFRSGTWLSNAIYNNGTYAIDYLDWTIPYAEVAWILAMLQATLAFEWVRRKAFEVFYYPHQLFIVFFVLANLHSWDLWHYFVFGLGLYLADRVQRLYRGFIKHHMVSLQALPGGIVRVEYTKGEGLFELKHEAGQFVFINIPAISPLQWHPFTISSAPYEKTITHHIKAMGPESFTRKLLTIASGDFDLKTIKIRVDGPLGTLGFTPSDYRSYILVAGGIGITPLLSLFKDLWGGKKTNSGEYRLIEKVVLYWIVRTPATLAAFSDELQTVLSDESLRSVFELRAFVTESVPPRPSSVDPLLAARADAELANALPSFPYILKKPTAEELLAPFRDISDRFCVAVSGPSSLVKSFRAATLTYPSKSTRFDFHQLSFVL
eukprot:CAMPEP_0196658544 /NCGR_PEP_ID=MMETSP1086-20130531/30241_1 /TAXON_ID=77921 /ORGANISM="Cyanoptyche  gloeocystis , Strain SAG4.97" /LENGTH=569 /DNA_ID=CAMNT_0041992163 /DNA_START=53 /DNA_END=1762 /DNA_ORIENTATION=-